MFGITTRRLALAFGLMVTPAAANPLDQAMSKGDAQALLNMGFLANGAAGKALNTVANDLAVQEIIKPKIDIDYTTNGIKPPEYSCTKEGVADLINPAYNPELGSLAESINVELVKLGNRLDVALDCLKTAMRIHEGKPEAKDYGTQFDKISDFQTALLIYIERSDYKESLESQGADLIDQALNAWQYASPLITEIPQNPLVQKFLDKNPEHKTTCKNAMQNAVESMGWGKALFNVDTLTSPRMGVYRLDVVLRKAEECLNLVLAAYNDPVVYDKAIEEYAESPDAKTKVEIDIAGYAVSLATIREYRENLAPYINPSMHEKPWISPGRYQLVPR